ncbi:hypothetical protein JCM11641_001440 [Rhodosporidiobolus odoratus]
MIASTSSAPKYPSTVAPVAYYDGLVGRLTEALLPVLEPYFASSSTRRVLELASGNGTHAALYAKTWPGVFIQPTETDTYGCAQVDSTCEREGVNMKGERLGDAAQVKLRKPEGGTKKAVVLDVMEEGDWEMLAPTLKEGDGNGDAKYDLIVGSNFLHMIPFPEGPRSIFSHLLPLTSHNARLVVYGPFRDDAGFLSTADEEFDAYIRARPHGSYLGLRSIEALGRLATEEGWKLENKVSMPTGNWVLAFKRV